jgi:hypothetical protein
MVTSTINSFIIIPIIYEWLHKKAGIKNINTPKEKSIS